MLEIILYQHNVCKRLAAEIQHNTLPPALLFTGKESSAKLTTALEIARLVSCKECRKEDCACDSCRRHNELTAADILIMGSRDSVLEIRAAARIFSGVKNAKNRAFFVRSVRKLTMRFDSRLWDSSDSRFIRATSLLADIESFLTDIPLSFTDTFTEKETKKFDKALSKLLELSEKLQETCMYDTIPVNHVRNVAAWMRLIPSGKKKVLIIDNADKMQDAARNAFLKTLEEPPEYGMFILTTQHRGAIIPTILSRVRTYRFDDRTAEQQQDIISRIFNNTSCSNNLYEVSVNAYLHNFLPVAINEITDSAALFWEYIFCRMEEAHAHIPQNLLATVHTYRTAYCNSKESDISISVVVKRLHNGKPHTIFLLFFKALTEFLRNGLRSGNVMPDELYVHAHISNLIRDAAMSTGVLNMSAQSTLENLAHKIIEAVS